MLLLIGRQIRSEQEARAISALLKWALDYLRHAKANAPLPPIPVDIAVSLINARVLRGMTDRPTVQQLAELNEMYTQWIKRPVPAVHQVGRVGALLSLFSRTGPFRSWRRNNQQPEK